MTERIFRGETEVIDFFAGQIAQNGSAELAGLEEEIILLDETGKPLRHDIFQVFIQRLMNALPGGRVHAGKHIFGHEIPVLRGTWRHGGVQPETNTTLVEFAHNPVASAWGSHRQSQLFATVLDRAAADHGFRILGAGSIPTMAWDEFRRRDIVIPNADFLYSWTHMAQGTRPEYCRTVFGTASTHHNMGFNDPARMAKYLTTTLRLQPTMIALTGNAPIWDHQRAMNDGPLLSHRSYTQLAYGSVFGMNGADFLYPTFLLNPDAGFEEIIRGYLDLPLDRTVVDGHKDYYGRHTMHDYMRDGIMRRGTRHYPTEDALTMMLREPIVDVRPAMGSAPRIETRAHDCVSQPVSVALDAFYRGVNANLDAVQDCLFPIGGQEIRRQRRLVCEQGLKSSLIYGGAVVTQQDLALALLELAEEGLQERGLGEEQLLAPLQVIASSGINPAERMLEVWDQKDPAALLGAIGYAQAQFADGTTHPWPHAAPRGDAQSTGLRLIREATEACVPSS